MRLDQASPALIAEIWTAASGTLRARPCVSEFAEAALDGLYGCFRESLVLARAFLTIPAATLPPTLRREAEALAARSGQSHLLSPHTPVACLIASRGREPAWNDWRQSRGHQAIPLLSTEFVAAIPMMARLLRELGLPLTWMQDPGADLQRQTLGPEVGLFLVEEARSAVDEAGRPVITGQDFVTAYSVQSVFAVGGATFGGSAFTMIFFADERIDQRTGRAFMPLVNQIKADILMHGSMGCVFPQSAGAAEALTISPAKDGWQG